MSASTHTSNRDLSVDTSCYVSIDERAALSRLPDIKSEFLRTINGVLLGTRVSLLEEIFSWIKQNSRERWLYILSGGAGTGKSTVAFTIADELKKSKLLGASFLFNRDSEEVTNTKNFVRSIARQLAENHPQLRSSIVEAIKRREAFGSLTLEEEFQLLVIAPLSKLPPSAPNLILVIDALDECLDRKSAQKLFHIISKNVGKSPIPLKIFLTGRPESHIDFPRLSNCILHNINGAVVNKDLLSFVLARLEEITIAFHIEEDWYTKEDVDALVNLCQTLSIYAATVLRYIEMRDHLSPQDKFKLLLKKDGPQSLHSPLDDLYKIIIHGIYEEGASN